MFNQQFRHFQMILKHGKRDRLAVGSIVICIDVNSGGKILFHQIKIVASDRNPE